MLAFIPILIREFCQAASHSFSYNLKINLYIWFGILWGLPIPLVTILIHIHFLEKAGSQELLLDVVRVPVQWFFLAHPLMFGIIFGILGTIRNEKDGQLNEAIKKLKELSSQDPLTVQHSSTNSCCILT